MTSKSIPWPVCLCLLACSQETPEPAAFTAKPAQVSTIDEPAPAPEQLPQGVEAPVAQGGVFQIGEPRTLVANAMLLRRLYREGKTDGSLLLPDATHHRYTLVHADESKAREMATLLDTSTAPATLPEQGVLGPSMQHTTISVNVRVKHRAGADLVRTLPKGSIVVAFHGDLDGHPSAAGGAGNWSFVVASENDEGWAASRYLKPYRECLPMLDHFVHELPKEQRHHVSHDTVVSAVHFRKDGKSRHGFMFIARDTDEKVSHVGVYGVRSAATCKLDHGFTIHPAGFVEEAFLTLSQPSAGETLVVVGSHPEAQIDDAGRVTWTVHRLNDPAAAPIFERTLTTGLNLTRKARVRISGGVKVGHHADRHYHALTITSPDGTKEFFDFVDGKLILASATEAEETPPPTPTPPAQPVKVEVKTAEQPKAEEAPPPAPVPGPAPAKVEDKAGETPRAE